jgi:hypothetical protein
MRRGMIFLALIFLVGFVSASITVQNSSVKSVYVPFEPLSGYINLTLKGESFLQDITSSSGGKISLKDFLTENDADYSCDPYDCSSNYEDGSSSTDKIFSLGLNQTVYVGFVLQGSNIEVTSLRFNMTSDFVENTKRPLSINFFEDTDWEFTSFSNLFGTRNFGCYDGTTPIQGPLIRMSTYCEVIPISETGSVFAGALVDSSDTVDLRMVLYSSDGGSSLGECEFTPGTEEGCQIDADEGEVFSSGDYHVCVEAIDPTNYHLYEDSAGESCGFVYSEGPNSSVKDYSIFASSAKYDRASSLDVETFGFEDLALAADSLLESKYNRNCTNKCVLPMAISGVPQNFRIYGVSLDYFKQGEDRVENKIYSLDMTPATVDFNGTLDLSFTGFNISKAGSYKVYIGETKILDKTIEILPAPIVKSLSPVNPPAGVPVNFFVLVDFNKSAGNLTYKWNFGDGKSEDTTVPFTVHSYKEIKNYTIVVEVSAGGNLTSKKGFVIATVSPKDSINSSIQSRKTALSDLVSEINTYPIWYQKEIEKRINLSYFQTEIARLERARDNANYDADYLKIAIDLYAMDIPTSIFVSDQVETPLLTDYTEVDPSIISNFAGGGYEEDFEAYKEAILRWQDENIQASIRSEVLSVERFSGDIVPLMRIYSVSFTSHADESESYLVINRPLSQLYFKEDPGARKMDDASLVVLDGVNKESFEFYYFDDTAPTSFFVSPKLTYLVLEENVDTTCNQNGVCEKGEGENADNCRSDCKPVGRMVLYLILVVFFGLILYSLVQLWYRRRYESYLFDDRRDLYNLLMYIVNARARGLEDSQISHDLKKQGWASERVHYAIAKSRGKSVGLPEIIPFSKISAHVRYNRAKNAIVTDPRQQMGRNINKSNFQRRV